jgi:hypothetical protein
LSQVDEPPDEDEDVEEVDEAGAESVQRPSLTCAQTLDSDWFARSCAACAQFAKIPIGQTCSPHPQTRSTAAPRILNPQLGITCVSTTSSGHIDVAAQS